MGEVVEIGKMQEIMVCGECQGTEFKLLAKGVPACNLCGCWLPVLLSPMPEWMQHAINEMDTI